MSEKNESIILQSKDNSLYYENERVIITSTSVFGELRKDLIKNIGKSRTRGFLLRYGWNLGKNDALKVKEQEEPIESLLRKGPVFHGLKGYTKVQNTKFEVTLDNDEEINTVEVEGIWFNSYEAEENLKLNGLEENPVCHTLIGYASGYYSTLCDQKVIFKEVNCRGKGDNFCTYVGKTLNLWGEEIEQELSAYADETIVQELKGAYENLLLEKENLSKVLKVNTKMTEEMINGENLTSIVQSVYLTTKLPVVVFDNQFQVLSSAANVESGEYSKMSILASELKNESSIGEYKFNNVIVNYKNMLFISPIQIQSQIYGYCAIYKEKGKDQLTDVENMILERLTMTCVLYFVNEQKQFDSIQRLKGNFLEQILRGQLKDASDIYQQARFIPLDIQKNYYIWVIRPNITLEESDVYNYLNEFEKLAHEIAIFFNNKKQEVLIGQNDGNLIIYILKEYMDTTQKARVVWNELIKQVKVSLPYFILRGGMSSLGCAIQDLEKHYKEAKSALNVGKRVGTLQIFEEIGMANFLLETSNIEAVEHKARLVLKELYEGEANAQTEQLRTLYIFLRNGGNLEQSANDLSLSVSGLRYRVQRIEEILTVDLRDPEETHEILLTIKLLLILQKITFN